MERAEKESHSGLREDLEMFSLKINSILDSGESLLKSSKEGSFENFTDAFLDTSLSSRERDFMAIGVMSGKEGILTQRVQNFISYVNNDSELVSMMSKLKSQKTRIKDMVTKKELKRFYYSDFLSQINLIQILGGDLAQYKNIEEFFKRNKQYYAAGEKIWNRDENGNELMDRAIFLEDIVRLFKGNPGEIFTNSIENIRKVLYSGTTGASKTDIAMIEGILYKIQNMEIKETDGQSFRTLKSIKKILQAAGGKWTATMEKSYQNIQNGSLYYEDFVTLWNSFKPFVFTHESRRVNGRNERVNLQYKNSEYMITAFCTMMNTALNQSPTLKALSEFMDKHDIDVAHFHSAVKIGYNNPYTISAEMTDAAERAVRPLRDKIAELKNEVNKKRDAYNKFRTLHDAEYTNNDILREADLKEAYDKAMKELDEAYKALEKENKKQVDIIISSLERQHTVETPLLNVIQKKGIGTLMPEDINDALKTMYPGLAEDKIDLIENKILQYLDELKARDRNIIYSHRLTETQLEGLNNCLPADTYVNRNFFHDTPLSDYMWVQPTDPHLQDQLVVFGSQLRNIMPADLPEDFTMTVDIAGKTRTLNREEAVKLYNTLIVDQLLDSFRQVSTKLGNIENLQRYLISQARSNPKYGPDVIAALELNEDHTGFRIPFNSPNLTNKIDDLIFSCFKKMITRQELKGGNVIMVSSFAFSEELQIQYKEDAEGNTVVDYIPCYLPAYMKSMVEDYIIEEIRDGRVYYMLDYEAMKANCDEELLRCIGYRIPTENKYSVLPLKIMGFMPISAGTTIMMPVDVLRMTGADFDIDKIFLMFRESRREVANRKNFVEYTKAFIRDNNIELTEEEVSYLENIGNNKFYKGLTEEEVSAAQKNLISLENTDWDIYHADYATPKYSVLKSYMPEGASMEDISELGGIKSPTMRKKIRNNMLIDTIEGISTSSYGSKAMMGNWNQYDNLSKASTIFRIVNDVKALASFQKEYEEEILEHGLLGALKSKTLEQLDDFYAKYAKTKSAIDIVDSMQIRRNLLEGNALIGIMAVNSSSHFKYQFLDLELLNPIDVKTSESSPTKTITKVDPVYSELDGTLVSNICAEFLAAAHANGKDPRLGYLGVTSKNASIVSLLSRIGLDMLTIGTYLNMNPILDKARTDIAGLNGKAYNGWARIEANKPSLILRNSALSSEDSDYFVFDVERVLDMITEYTQTGDITDKEYAYFLMQFHDHIKAVADDLNSPRGTTRCDTTSNAAAYCLAANILKWCEAEDFKANSNDPSFHIKGLNKVLDIDLSPNAHVETTKEGMDKELQSLRKKFLQFPIERLQAFYTLGIKGSEVLTTRIIPYNTANTLKAVADLRMNMQKSLVPKYQGGKGIIKQMLAELTMFLLSDSEMFGQTADSEGKPLSLVERRNKYIYAFPAQLAHIISSFKYPELNDLSLIKNCIYQKNVV